MYVLNANSVQWFGGLKPGFHLIALNGLLNCLGLYELSVKRKVNSGRQKICRRWERRMTKLFSGEEPPVWCTSWRSVRAAGKMEVQMCSGLSFVHSLCTWPVFRVVTGSNSRTQASSSE